MISILLCAAVLAQEEIPFPVFEKDPWGPFGTGSTVTRQTTTAQAKTEETWTLKSVGKDSKIFTVSKMGQAEQEETVKFVSFTEGLVAPDSGHKLSGKSNRMYTIGGKGVKALLREFTPTRFALNNYRVATADEAPGGIVEIVWKAEDDVTHNDVTYTMKSFEPVKVGTQTIDCAKIDLTATETKTRKRKIEGNY